MRVADPDQPCYCLPRIVSLPSRRRLAKSIFQQNAARWRILPVILRNALDFAPFSGGSAENRHWTERRNGTLPSFGNCGLVAFRATLFLVPTETPFKPLKTVLSPFCSCRSFCRMCLSRKHPKKRAMQKTKRATFRRGVCPRPCPRQCGTPCGGRSSLSSRCKGRARPLSSGRMPRTCRRRRRGRLDSA